MNINDRIQAFSKLGIILNQFLNYEKKSAVSKMDQATTNFLYRK